MSKLDDILSGKPDAGTELPDLIDKRYKIKSLMLELIGDADYRGDMFPSEMTGNSGAEYLNGYIRRLRQKVSEL